MTVDHLCVIVGLFYCVVAFRLRIWGLRLTEGGLWPGRVPKAPLRVGFNDKMSGLPHMPFLIGSLGRVIFPVFAVLLCGDVSRMRKVL